MFACQYGVVKLPIQPKGARCNTIERDRWRDRHGLNLDEWLCPVIACADDGSWIIMARAGQTIETTPAHPHHVQRLKDTGAKNWGWLNNRPVLVDYGQED